MITQDTELSGFAVILLFIVGGGIFVTIALLVAKMIRPDRPNDEKLTTYECGEDPSGSAWGQFNSRFYIIALIFILFDVEIVFLFPWATVFGQKELIEGTQGLWGWFSLVEMFIFIGVLAMGLAYAWAKGFLDWIKPQVRKQIYTSHIPRELYNKISEKY
ncbi:NADH-quinone oxidoreductase subunit A [Catalinimonas niigatensis]|uniref:NADH-quinone oxidoreductase subunit A n=1 Tax=Catalinimonas niigatensis TaxID=1397264 RepID=UPI00266701D2|nr:NADH-quinone oxidoreductase subunit A [Catalinimonas niigatensis]WPP48610.1 NADH-quinone oxidoreductase subunit A [Catalinimonas niigatensis]